MIMLIAARLAKAILVVQHSFERNRDSNGSPDVSCDSAFARMPNDKHLETPSSHADPFPWHDIFEVVIVHEDPA